MGEIVYQGASIENPIAFGKVQEWDLPNTSIRLTNISGIFSNTSLVIGATSNARYSISTYDPINEPKIENAWDNKVIEDETDLFIDKSEVNPFGLL